MLQQIRRDRHWRCLANPMNQGLVQQIGAFTDLDELLEKLNELPCVLKDNHRSRVLKGTFFLDETLCKSIVAKQPRNKNHSAWSRALSFLRNGEARQTFLALQHFQELGIAAGEPILVLEKRRYGMVLDSWVVYEYLAGEVCGVDHLPEIIRILMAIHEAGYQHKDPTLDNFLVDDDGKLFVIDCVLRPGLGNFSRCRDLMILADNNDGVDFAQVEPILRDYKGTLGYGFYHLYRSYKRTRDALKYKVRGRKPKNR